MSSGRQACGSEAEWTLRYTSSLGVQLVRPSGATGLTCTSQNAISVRTAKLASPTCRVPLGSPPCRGEEAGGRGLRLDGVRQGGEARRGGPMLAVAQAVHQRSSLHRLECTRALCGAPSTVCVWAPPIPLLPIGRLFGLSGHHAVGKYLTRLNPWWLPPQAVR